jgi:DNA-directed RNA polymerase subunit RPC12/RpoP
MADEKENESTEKPFVLPYQGPHATRGVTIQTFYDPLQAQLLANELTEQGIECFLLNQNVSGLGAYSTFCQVELQVREQDVAEAKRILAEFQGDPSKEKSDASSEPDDEGEPRCPKCGSYRVIEAPRPWPGLLKFLFGGSDSRERHVECLRCHHRWRR